MQLRLARIPPSFFGLAALCFLLPFVTLSCPGQSITLSGLQLSTGISLEASEGLHQDRTPDRVPSDPVVFTALLVALVGAPATMLVKDRNGSSVLGMILGSAGAGLLAILFGKLFLWAEQGTQGILQLRLEIGFWLALFSFLAAAGTSLLRLRAPEPAKTPPPIAPIPGIRGET